MSYVTTFTVITDLYWGPCMNDLKALDLSGSDHGYEQCLKPLDTDAAGGGKVAGNAVFMAGVNYARHDAEELILAVLQKHRMPGVILVDREGQREMLVNDWVNQSEAAEMGYGEKAKCDECGRVF